MTNVSIGFDLNPLLIPVEKILASRKIPTGVSSSRKYSQIKTSIQEIGLIEPLSICSTENDGSQYILLDGHIRFMILKDLGFIEIPCLIATDDEGYTYNSRINRLSTIQEHHMIHRAIERGVTPEKLAKALSVDLVTIQRKSALLDGICSEAAELLKDRQFSYDLSRVLRKMKPTRQIECVELMISANTITVKYAQAMLMATPEEMLVGEKKLKNTIISAEQMARMEREMTNLQDQYKMVEQTYSQDVLNLVVAKGYLSKLLENQAVNHYLIQKQPEVFSAFGKIVEMITIAQ